MKRSENFSRVLLLTLCAQMSSRSEEKEKALKQDLNCFIRVCVTMDSFHTPL